MDTLAHAAGLLAATVPRQVIPARAQMATTLGFHIILACFGIAFPTIVLSAEYLGLRRGDEVAMTLAKRWSQALGVLVAVGTVTGTVLSFEMGLLWPGLMRQYGSVIGLPFGFEAIFFFLEAIFTAIYLYGWRRLRGWAHFWSGIPVAVSGIFGAISVMAANAWMNQPSGFTLSHGRVVAVNPWEVFLNRAAAYETPHMVLAAYLVTGFSVAAVYAVGILRGRNDRYHQLGFKIPFTLAAVLTPVQIIVGDTAARAVAADQPVKFAAMEYVMRTASGVPEYFGGIYANGHIYLGLKIPDLDSLLVGFSAHTKVIGLDSVPPSERPPALALIHISFDAMIALAFVLLAAGLWALVTWRKRHALPRTRWFWWLGLACGPAAVAAMECGWIVTEVGRQPWVVYKLLTTAQAATTNQGVITSLTAVLVLYAALGVATVLILRMLARRWREGPHDGGETAVPYGPPLTQILEQGTEGSK
jgi:cytochrome bd ubiquinol oxidase subunit I